MNKILFVTQFDFSQIKTGGLICSYRNYLSIKDLQPNSSITLLTIKKKSRKNIIDTIKKNLSKFFFNNDYDLSPLFHLENLLKYDIIFLDSSTFGKASKLLRKIGYKGKIITFFHNCEYNFSKQFFSSKNKLIQFINNKCTYKNEYNALYFSDTCICLNKRDSSIIYNIYQRKIDHIIPISIKDTFDININKFQYKTNKKIFLFIGSYFFGNTLGLHWFINNVYPHINIQLVIIGKDMDKFYKEINIPEIIIYSNVDNIAPYIIAADCMLFPIFDGAGMKVKTCEALMYGKNIIGTPEAFEGYEIDYKKVGACCQTKDEFITAIKTFCDDPLPIFNQYARKMYEEKYSYTSTLRKFKEIFITQSIS